MKDSEMKIPYLFMCPISLDLFRDPVTLTTGQTYDRSSIEKWLDAGNITCPVTMQKLEDLSMVPNHTLSHLIREWLQLGHQIDPDYYFNFIDIDQSLASLMNNLMLEDSSLETKLHSLQKIQDLFQEQPLYNSSLIRKDLLPLLLKLIFKNPEECEQMFIEQALVCTQKLLPFSDLGCLNMLKQEPKLISFAFLFQQGNSVIKMILCQIIESISLSLATKDLSRIIGKNHLILQTLILLLHEPTEVSESGIRAISALSTVKSNRENLVKQGSIDGLVSYILSSSERRSSSQAVTTLEQLVETESGTEAIVNTPKGVSVLVKMVFRVSEHEVGESAVNALVSVCGGSTRAREEAISAGVLTQLLLLLQSQCSGTTKGKARSLLKLLRSSDLCSASENTKNALQ